MQKWLTPPHFEDTWSAFAARVRHYTLLLLTLCYRALHRGDLRVAGRLFVGGLGLAIVRKIADMHRATINVHSQPGIGTTFTVGFPLEAETAAEATA